VNLKFDADAKGTQSVTDSSNGMQEYRQHSDEQEQYIVCVDDDPNFLRSLSFLLPENITSEGHGKAWYRVLYLENALEALNCVRDLLAERQSVAMVISDQKMPQMKGTEFLDQIRKISPDSVRVLLTGYAGLESAIEAINNKLLDKYRTYALTTG
jgi:DNA-binding NtrC family response regulator